MYSMLSVNILMVSDLLPLPVVVGLYVLMVIMVSASVPIIVITNMLKRGNVMSEDIVGFDSYARYINESAHLDKVAPNRIDYFVEEYARSPFADGDDGDGWKETDDIYGDLPDVDKPLFAPPRD